MKTDNKIGKIEESVKHDVVLWSKEDSRTDLETLVASWLKQATGNNAVISGTKAEKRFCNLTQVWALNIL